MFDIDMSGYNGAEDLKILADFIERIPDCKGLRFKLGGWPEHQSFNQALEETPWYRDFDSKWGSKTRLEGGVIERILRGSGRWGGVEVMDV